MDIIKAIEHEQLKETVPVLDVGNTVRVSVKIKEGEKERIQVFEGIIIKKQGGGLNETFTVRKISYGVGVEKTFLLHSPMVEKVEVVRVGKARRAKLNYLRDRIGKDAKTKEKVGARIENKVVVLKEAIEETIETEEVIENVETVENVEAVETTQNVEVVENAGTAENTEAVETVKTEEDNDEKTSDKE
ncbi:MAG: 50S ribosomal protein L19 [Clostridia bacterium]|nr:50S ribosomal protein L19 [Clostridia bacterium]